MSTNVSRDSDLAARNLSAADRVISSDQISERYAIIIGISKYNDDSLNLEYARRDAEAIYEFLHSEQGGGYQDDKISLLLDEDATTQNINDVLHKFVRKPQENDLLFIYFACHGAQDPKQPSEVYLLSHDTDRNDLRRTAVPMDRIYDSILDHVKANRIVIIADACHSAAMGNEMTSDKAVNKRLREKVAKAKRGISLLTSSTETGLAFEDDAFGGGHGVFTHFLLKGMAEGIADWETNDGIVSVGELFRYVEEQVKKATDIKQSPETGGKDSDDRLAISFVGNMKSQDHYELGCLLFHPGLIILDGNRIGAAIDQFKEAIRLRNQVSRDSTSAYIQLARCLIVTRNYRVAKESLESALAQGPVSAPADLYLYLGILQARCGERDGAISSLTRFLESDRNHDKIWATKYLELLHKKRGRKRFVLLISGAGQQNVSTAKDHQENVKFMKTLLLNYFAFTEDSFLEIKSDLRGVTVPNVKHMAVSEDMVLTVETFARLKVSVSEDDEVVVYVSGHLFEGTNGSYFWITERKQGDQVISVDALHDFMSSLPCKHKTLVIDANQDHRLRELAERDHSYNLLFARTNTLAKRLLSTPLNFITFSAIDEWSKEGGKNELYLSVSDPSEVIFGGRDPFQTLFELGIRENFACLSESDIDAMKVLLQSIGCEVPQARYALARVLLEKKRYQDALNELEIDVSRSGRANPKVFYSLGITQVALNQYDDAKQSLEICRRMVGSSSSFAHVVDSIIKVIEGAKKSNKKYALLVGIDGYDDRVRPLKGAVNDIQGVRRVLIDSLDFEEADIVVLSGREASLENLRIQFRELLAKSRDHALALFYFSGYGSISAENGFVLVVYPGLSASIPLQYFSEESQKEQDCELVSIIDARWTEDSMAAQMTPRYSFDHKGNPEIELIGKVSLISFPKRNDFDGEIGGESEFVSPVDADKKLFHGDLTYHLIKSLLNRSDVTYSELFEGLSNEIKPSPVRMGGHLDVAAFGTTGSSSRIIDAWKGFEMEALADGIISKSERIIARMNDTYPEGHLEVGLAYGLKGDYARAIESMKKALLQREGYEEARYNLSRLLYEKGDDPDSAVDALRETIAINPVNYQAYLYLAKALKLQFEKKTLTEIKSLYEKYLENGAPLGHAEDIEAYLHWSQSDL